MNVFNHKELEGEKVNCVVNGNGEIVKTYGEGRVYPVSIQFCGVKELYTEEGKLARLNMLPALSFGHKEPKVHDYGKPSTAKKCKKKKLNFEKWLKANEVELIACNSDALYSLAITSKRSPKEWSSVGLLWEFPISAGSSFWYDLHKEWQQAVTTAEETGTPIVFGFKKLLKKG